MTGVPGGSRASDSKRLALRRAERCVTCGRELPVGEQAIWHQGARCVTCVDCALPEAASSPLPGVPVEPLPEPTEGQAGASSLREYQRRHDKREQHARERLGRVGVFLARVIDEPQSTTSWKQGGLGEVRVGERLEKLLGDTGVRLLHDRRVPGHGNANIDHIAVGPGGVTVIDAKTHRGKIRTERWGGLLSERRTVLLIGGREQTKLVSGVERQVEWVRRAVGGGCEVKGALCFPDPDGLPLFKQLSVGDVVIDSTRRVARLAARPGPHHAAAVERIWRELAVSFPSA